MNWKDTAELLNKTEIQDENGNTIYFTTSRTVYCNVKSIKASEFYKAASTSLKPELTLVLRTFEYQNETLVKYNNITYRVLRVYVTGENTELTLTLESLK